MELIASTSGAVPAPSPTDTSSPVPMPPREFVATATPTPGSFKKRPFPTDVAPVAPLPIQLHHATTMPVAACNFSALSHHFHLPLKVAAEKFGVRATAFKKRCRAIGIRHWPYRKVRSLKRSLQELAECKQQADNGSGPPLTDKQVRQHAVYQSQLARLLAPETYGIDPNGQLLPHHFFAHDEDVDSDDDSCGSMSPRVHPSPAAHGVMSLPPGVTPSRKTKARKHFFTDSPSGSSSSHDGMFFCGPMTTVNGAIFDSSYLSGAAAAGDLPPSSSLGGAPGLVNAHAGLAFDSLYDPFGGMDDFAGNDHPSCGYSLDSVSYDFFPLHPSPTMAARKAVSQATSAPSTCSSSTATSSSCTSRTLSVTAGVHSISGATTTASSSSLVGTPSAGNDVTDDDIFRHISPEYGCLV